MSPDWEDLLSKNPAIERDRGVSSTCVWSVEGTFMPSRKRGGATELEGESEEEEKEEEDLKVRLTVRERNEDFDISCAQDRTQGHNETSTILNEKVMIK